MKKVSDARHTVSYCPVKGNAGSGVVLVSGYIFELVIGCYDVVFEEYIFNQKYSVTIGFNESLSKLIEHALSILEFCSEKSPAPDFDEELVISESDENKVYFDLRGDSGRMFKLVSLQKKSRKSRTILAGTCSSDAFSLVSSIRKVFLSAFPFDWQTLAGVKDFIRAAASLVTTEDSLIELVLSNRQPEILEAMMVHFAHHKTAGCLCLMLISS